MNKLLLLFILVSLPVFSEEIQEEIYQFENLRIIKKPTSAPGGVITSDFICDKATLIQSIELRNVSDMSPEASLFLHSTLTVEELIRFYETVFLAGEWRILQKDNRDNKFVLLGERSKKVMTVLIRDEKDYRAVKIFYRRPGF